MTKSAHKLNTKLLFFSITVALAVGAITPSPFSFVPPVSAQSVITAIPPRLVLSGKPGETINAQLKVRNDSEEAQNYTVAVEDFIVYDTQGTPIPVAQSAGNRWSLASWVSAPDVIPVDTKTTQIVNIRIKVPLTALPGGHYAMLTYMPNGDVKPGQMKKTASIIGQRVGTLIYFTVAGPVTEKLNILKFSVPQFSEQGPINFTGTLESLSDIHITPVGNITISDPLRTKVAEVPVEAGSVFPETQRDFVSTWTQKWGWGKYRADLNLAYGTTGAVATATIFFWLFPIRLVIYSLIAIISILTAIILLNKRSKRHQEMLEKEVTELKEELEKLEESKK
ncbi:hypothetical protein A3K29_05630 [Candidatus Collierbacteria bacterium RIFOXYB2_FULL_46_14]|uniref:DUF916 domain-containing protein n=1 Tax=Candidatus Collierbacteria bacterium GW2011_GWA2_46_26 TaxID=1618381 RepID=A0A0G1PIT9_9BACT|nr:MAG: hypothetical protein UX47_C0009G0034 [Candidatus Collierbacteria bacterium GW2011_GWA2_46_26]OGD73569.1 MAG: hypothetical protein A3K29_05630 [Candidatus Collierbacteria bacterium RIFOXYB2_FULL_46_14]OGD76611.1 MAG: hypothetical protein A3K43_05630 [Candidatus Collierbacteria bacterium RIFOXYA2_FULL_46_20]OGD77947.1 MAG: hypothetical protein A3K39_05630 [Candidatus Collierbacteria bacterium RIFOXYC2_FULL_43_15]OGD79971.1 MAG: hypothetical protein A2320_00060 [Pseudomonadales bacterium G